MKKIATSTFTLLIALTLTAQSTKQVLHTTNRETTFGKSKTEYIYDEFGNELKEERSYWDANLLRWNSDYKTEQIYDALGNLTKYENAYWDNSTLRWTPNYRYEYFCKFGDYLPDSKRYIWNEYEQEWQYFRHWYRKYNPDGQISESVYLYKIEGATSWKDEYIYDENNRLTQKINWLWDEYEQKWGLNQKDVYQYNSEGQQVERQYFTINSSQIWELIRKYEYTYASNGEVASDTQYNIENNVWQPIRRTIYEYNALDKITLRAEQNWQEDFQDWANIQADEYTYDAVGNKLTETYTRWDQQTLSFQESRRYEYQYDHNNNLVEYIFELGGAIGQYFPYVRDIYTYNYDYEYDDLVTSYIGDIHNNMLIGKTRERWSGDLNEWAFEFNETYEYTPTEIRLSPILDVNYVCVSVHPNPATDYIIFRAVGASTPVRVRLFDAIGKAVGEEILGEGNAISVSHLQRGVYFYQLLYNGIQQGGKFMVK